MGSTDILYLHTHEYLNISINRIGEKVINAKTLGSKNIALWKILWIGKQNILRESFAALLQHKAQLKLTSLVAPEHTVSSWECMFIPFIAQNSLKDPWDI